MGTPPIPVDAARREHSSTASFMASSDDRIRALLEKMSSRNAAPEEGLQVLAQSVCELTQASGAAIALDRGGRMLCVARFGRAPDLGALVDPESGLSGECMRVRGVVHCHDILTDPRIDPVACLRLNVRSALVLPIFRGEQMHGLVEVLSSKPRAFHDADVWLLSQLADMAGRIAAGGTAGIAPVFRPAGAQSRRRSPIDSGATERNEARRPGKHAIASPGQSVRPALAWRFVSSNPRRKLRWDRREPQLPSSQLTKPSSGVRSIMRVALVIWLLTALLFGTWIAYRRTGLLVQPAPNMQNSRLLKSGISAGPGSAPRVFSPSENLDFRVEVADFLLQVRQLAQATGLSVAEMLPPAAPYTAGAPSPILAGTLLKRVEPIYPLAARGQRLHGPVVLRVRVGRSGRVQHLTVVRGQPVLSAAAAKAVKQWEYEPFRMNGVPVEQEILVTLHFKPLN